MSIVTDGISAGLLYGGVGTAILLATLIANRLGGDLRIVSRRQDADAGQVRALLSTFGVGLDGRIECLSHPTGRAPTFRSTRATCS